MQYKWLFFIGWCLSACADSEVPLDTDRLGLHYFPLEVGSYRIYDVVETKYSVLGNTTTQYELKESVVESNLNASNNLQYIIHRATRANDSEAWHLDSVWTAQKNTSIATLTENNVPFIKLSFPIANKATWDGNALNSLETENYWYDADLPDTTLYDTLYQNIIQVVQNNKGDDFLGFEYKSETFAPYVGMIIKESSIKKYCQLDCNTEKQVDSGRDLVMTLKAYGKE